jgi:peptide/nickel transport system substrate-binding protein/oligopeptide transport system substrate-binding protein
MLEYPSTHFLKVLCHHSFVPIHPSHPESERLEFPYRSAREWTVVLAEKGPNTWVMKKNPYYWEADQVFVETIRILLRKIPSQLPKKIQRL